MKTQSRSTGNYRKYELRPVRIHPDRWATATTLSENQIHRGEPSEAVAAYTATEEKTADNDDAYLNEWMELVQIQLDEIASLPEGWDSNGASSPNLYWIESARDFIDSLSQAGFPPQPYVNPTPNGGVQFEWEWESRYFEVEIVGEGLAEYFYRDTEMQEEYEGNLQDGSSLQDVVQYIHRVFNQ